jgi:hypothetical protein
MRIAEPAVLINVHPCSTLEWACNKAQRISDKIGEPVMFTFNSVECVAVVGGSPDQLAQRYHDEHTRVPRVFSDE